MQAAWAYSGSVLGLVFEPVALKRFEPIQVFARTFLENNCCSYFLQAVPLHAAGVPEGCHFLLPAQAFTFGTLSACCSWR